MCLPPSEIPLKVKGDRPAADSDERSVRGDQPEATTVLNEATETEGMYLCRSDTDGTKYGNPKYSERNQKRLKLLQQRFARTKMRTDFLHKLTTDLVNRFDTICLENLNVDRILKSLSRMW